MNIISRGIAPNQFRKDIIHEELFEYLKKKEIAAAISRVAPAIQTMNIQQLIMAYRGDDQSWHWSCNWN